MDFNTNQENNISLNGATISFATKQWYSLTKSDDRGLFDFSNILSRRKSIPFYFCR